MIRTGDTIFVAGSPDVVDAVDPHSVWEGRRGGIVAAFAANDGRKLAEYKLPAPPVWGGMAAANNQLFISTMDGYVVCMDKKR
jgi:sugar lactone lactonase YvrE